jgi:hypothetical protein
MSRRVYEEKTPLLSALKNNFYNSALKLVKERVSEEEQEKSLRWCVKTLHRIIYYKYNFCNCIDGLSPPAKKLLYISSQLTDEIQKRGDVSCLSSIELSVITPEIFHLSRKWAKMGATFNLASLSWAVICGDCEIFDFLSPLIKMDIESMVQLLVKSIETKNSKMAKRIIDRARESGLNDRYIQPDLIALCMAETRNWYTYTSAENNNIVDIVLLLLENDYLAKTDQKRDYRELLRFLIDNVDISKERILTQINRILYYGYINPDVYILNSTILYLCLHNGDRDLVKIVLKYCDVNQLCFSNQEYGYHHPTALTVAVDLTDNEGIVNDLIQAGAVCRSDVIEDSPLAIALDLDRSDGIVLKLIEAIPTSAVDSKIRVSPITQGFTSNLILGIASNRVGVVEKLLEQGADPNLPVNTGVERIYPLQAAKDPRIAKCLVKYGADVKPFLETQHETEGCQSYLQKHCEWARCATRRVLENRLYKDLIDSVLDYVI